MMTRDDFDRIHSVRNDGQACMTAINMDALTDAELEIARDHPALHSDVREIARVLIKARALRLEGNVEQASRLENGRAERLYETLPTRLQW